MDINNIKSIFSIEEKDSKEGVAGGAIFSCGQGMFPSKSNEETTIDNVGEEYELPFLKGKKDKVKKHLSKPFMPHSV